MKIMRWLLLLVCIAIGAGMVVLDAQSRIRLRAVASSSGSTPGFPMTCDATVTASGGVLSGSAMSTAWSNAVSGTEGDPYILCIGAGTYTGGDISLGSGK